MSQTADSRPPESLALASGLQVANGTATLPLLFLGGRRVFSPAAGLIAAAALAFMPRHTHASGYFEPEALPCFAVVLALRAELRFRSPSGSTASRQPPVELQRRQEAAA